MKKFVAVIVGLFVCLSGFTQTFEKQYFENNQDVGGEARIKSSVIRVENDEIFKTFEIESLEDEVYFIDAWMEAALTKEGYREYKVAVNGVPTGLSFKAQIDGWHSLALTDAKKSVATVSLKKGKNTVSIIGKKIVTKKNNLL